MGLSCKTLSTSFCAAASHLLSAAGSSGSHSQTASPPPLLYPPIPLHPPTLLHLMPSIPIRQRVLGTN